MKYLLHEKLTYYHNAKDKVPECIESHTAYEFCCPVYNKKYIGKTVQNFCTHVQEHSGFTGLQSLVSM